LSLASSINPNIISVPGTPIDFITNDVYPSIKFEPLPLKTGMKKQEVTIIFFLTQITAIIVYKDR
jgi:hypothetical protein